MWVPSDWKDYELIDCDDGERLERWGRYILIRPDPQVIWKGSREADEWKRADGIYRRSSSGGGAWIESRLPSEWTVSYKSLRFILKPMGFKHTGIFPEQAANWDWFSSLIRNSGRRIRVLNLFAYTGGATLAAAEAGASVCHVDSAKGMVSHARENAKLSGLESAPVRYIVDDCVKFVERELRRGNRYDAVIMDPPSYGRGPSGEIWKLEESADRLISLCADLLSEKPLFFLVSSYTAGLSPLTVRYIVDRHLTDRLGGRSDEGELALRVSSSKGFLPCGSSVRWTFGG